MIAGTSRSRIITATSSPRFAKEVSKYPCPIDVLGLEKSHHSDKTPIFFPFSNFKTF